MKPKFSLIVLIFTILHAIILPNSDISGKAASEFQSILKMPSSGAITSFYSSEPDYDSGWNDIGLGEDLLLPHNLGGNPDDYIVDLQGYNPALGSHQLAYGGDTHYETDDLEHFGFYWHGLSSSSIKVKRNISDVLVTQARIRIWVVPNADFDSGWFDIAKIQEIKLIHNLGGDPGEYIVDLQFKDTGGLGVNIGKYGTDTYLANGVEFTWEGAGWKKLTSTSISVVRGQQDEFADKVRVRIWFVSGADFDSGWKPIAPDEIYTLNHNLGGPWNDFVVDLQLKDNNPSGEGVHQFLYGGNSFSDNPMEVYGVGLYKLNGKSVSIWRGANDYYGQEFRVRVWARPEPKYDSGWKPIGKNENLTITHNLGGNPDHYVVNLTFKDTNADGVIGSGINQVGYGGNLYVRNNPSSDSLAYGVYWYGLTKTSLKVHREKDNTDADEIRVRIWMPPAPAYDSGWASVAPSIFPTQLLHLVGGNPDDYVIDMQFKDADGSSGLGVHQWAYGYDMHVRGDGSYYAIGATWSELNNSTIDLSRLVDDSRADFIRIRIWKNINPDYNSGWKTLNAGKEIDLEHKLGGNPDNYVLELIFWDGSSSGPNKFFYGGNTYFEKDGTQTRLGSYWFNLNDKSVKVYREDENVSAPQIKMRIWIKGNKPIPPSNLNYLPAIFLGN